MRLKTLLILTCAAAAIAPSAASAATATLSGPDTVERNRTAKFTCGGTGHNGYGLSCQWDVTNDGTFDYSWSYYHDIYYSWDTLGQVTMRVRVSGAGVANPTAAEVTKTITVVNAKPDLAFSCDTDKAETGEQLTCETDQAADVDGQVTKLEWDVDGDGFDDGEGDELTTAYAAAGTKTIRLRATDNDGGTTVKEDTVTVWAPGAGLAFEMNPQPATEGDEVTFTAPLEAGEQGDVVYERKWDLDGDGQWDEEGTGSALRTVSAYYDEAGEIRVRMRVHEDGSAPETAKVTTQTLVVKKAPVIEEPRKDTNTGDNGGGRQSGGTQNAAPAPAPVVAAPAPAPAASRTVAPARKAASKKKAAKKCKTVKGKKARKAKTSCARKTKKSTRAKARNRR
jgi:hypothetical protein